MIFQSYFSLIKSSFVFKSAQPLRLAFNPILVWLNQAKEILKKAQKEKPTFNPILVWLNQSQESECKPDYWLLSILF